MKPKPTRQARSQETLKRILDACDSLLKQKTFEQITMQDIASKAGVSVGNLYNRFEDRGALIEHLLLRYQEQFLDEFMRALARRPPSADLAQKLLILAQCLQASIANLRPAFLMLASRPTIQNNKQSGTQANTDQIVESAVEWLAQNPGDQESAIDPERARFVIASMAMQLQFDLIFGTGTRLFGDRLLESLAQQAHHHLAR